MIDLDKLSSKAAFLTAYRCKKFSRIERKPPFGANVAKQIIIYSERYE